MSQIKFTKNLITNKYILNEILVYDDPVYDKSGTPFIQMGIKIDDIKLWYPVDLSTGLKIAIQLLKMIDIINSTEAKSNV